MRADHDQATCDCSRHQTEENPPKRRKQPVIPATIVYAPTAKRVATLKRWRQLTGRDD
jgi:hypothetical protein